MKVVRLCAAAAVLVSGLVFVSCNDTATPTGPTLTGNVYNNPTIGFAVEAPAGYVLIAKDTTLGGQTCILRGSDTAANTADNFSIVTIGNNGVTDAVAMAETPLRFLPQQFTDFAVVPSPDTINAITIDGKTCAMMTYTYTVTTPAGPLPMKNKMIYMIHNGLDLILTFVDMEQAYPANESKFDAMIETIDFK